MTCPFCQEGDFDAPGMWAHLAVWDCEKFIEAKTEYQNDQMDRAIKRKAYLEGRKSK